MAKDTTIHLTLTEKEAVAFASILGFIGTLNALPDVTQLCSHLLAQIETAVAKDKDKNATRPSPC